MEEMRSFGYICPACGKAVLHSRSVFAMQKVLFQLPVFFIFLCQHPEVILAFCLFQRSRFLLQRLLLPLLPAAPLFPLYSLLLKPHLQRPAAFA